MSIGWVREKLYKISHKYECSLLYQELMKELMKEGASNSAL